MVKDNPICTLHKARIEFCKLTTFLSRTMVSLYTDSSLSIESWLDARLPGVNMAGSSCDLQPGWTRPCSLHCGLESYTVALLTISSLSVLTRLLCSTITWSIKISLAGCCLAQPHDQGLRNSNLSRVYPPFRKTSYRYACISRIYF